MASGFFIIYIEHCFSRSFLKPFQINIRIRNKHIFVSKYLAGWNLSNISFAKIKIVMLVLLCIESFVSQNLDADDESLVKYKRTLLGETHEGMYIILVSLSIYHNHYVLLCVWLHLRLKRSIFLVFQCIFMGNSQTLVAFKTAWCVSCRFSIKKRFRNT